MSLRAKIYLILKCAKDEVRVFTYDDSVMVLENYKNIWNQSHKYDRGRSITTFVQDNVFLARKGSTTNVPPISPPGHALKQVRRVIANGESTANPSDQRRQNPVRPRILLVNAGRRASVVLQVSTCLMTLRRVLITNYKQKQTRCISILMRAFLLLRLWYM